jgi:adenine-specific DNA methylase
LFNPRQLLYGAIFNKNLTASSNIPFLKLLDYNAKLCRWHSNLGAGRVGKTENVFYNQSLNTLFNYATRASEWMAEFFNGSYKEFEIYSNAKQHPMRRMRTIMGLKGDSISSFQTPYGSNRNIMK